MRYVIDTNQLGHVIRSLDGDRKSAATLNFVLPPLIWAEAILYERGKDHLRALTSLRCSYGLDLQEFLLECAKSGPDEMASKTPWTEPGSSEHRRLENSLVNPPRELIEAARSIKLETRRFLERMSVEIINMRKAVSQKSSDGKHSKDKIGAFQEALQKYPNRSDAYLRAEYHGIRQRGGHTVASESEFVAGMKSNQYICRYLNATLCYVLSWAQMWTEPKLNFAPTSTSDDGIDIHLHLYARPGDIVVSGEKRISKVLRHMDPEGKIESKPWSECVD